jgi:hypothetical protein
MNAFQEMSLFKYIGVYIDHILVMTAVKRVLYENFCAVNMMSKMFKSKTETGIHITIFFQTPLCLNKQKIQSSKIKANSKIH